MSIQEKIDQLALAVLRSAPVSNARPQPATFMLPFEKPRMVAIAQASGSHRDARYVAHSTDRAPSIAPWPFEVRDLSL